MEEFKNYVRTKSLFDLFNECTDKEIVNFFNSKKNPITVIDVGGKDGKELKVKYDVVFDYKIMEYDKKYSGGANRIYGDITDCPHIGDNSYDLVMSVNTLEHVTEPWKGADNMVRILKPESLLLAVAPFKWNYHEHPIDFWRFSPKGLEYLYDGA